MARTRPFEEHVDRYEAWFVEHRCAFESEVRAIRRLLKPEGMGVEIGVGTGRFAAALHVEFGIEPARAMRKIARGRGIKVVGAVAEALPFADGCFDYALMVTTICFVDSVSAAIAEARRVLRPGGSFIVGFVDRESPLGETYQRHKEENVFYREADFYSTDEVVAALQTAGFGELAFSQTIFLPLHRIQAVEPVKDGHGEGSFVVVRGSGLSAR